MVPFYLQDDCGVILIRPEGAKLEPVETVRRDRSAAAIRSITPKARPVRWATPTIAAVSSKRGIPQHAMLYVIGQARERPDVVAAEIAHDRQRPDVSDLHPLREQIGSGMKWGQWLWPFLA